MHRFSPESRRFPFPTDASLEAHQGPGGPELSCLCFPPASAFGLMLPGPARVLTFPLPTWRLEPQSPLCLLGLNTRPFRGPASSCSHLSPAEKLHPTHARVQSSLQLTTRCCWRLLVTHRICCFYFWLLVGVLNSIFTLSLCYKSLSLGQSEHSCDHTCVLTNDLSPLFGWFCRITEQNLGIFTWPRV